MGGGLLAILVGLLAASPSCWCLRREQQQQQAQQNALDGQQSALGGQVINHYHNERETPRIFRAL